MLKTVFKDKTKQYFGKLKNPPLPNDLIFFPLNLTWTNKSFYIAKIGNIHTLLFGIS